MPRASMIALLVFVSTNTAAAQGGDRPAEAGQAQRGRGNGQGADRSLLERQFRQRLAQRARAELGLTSDQMVTLEDVARRFGQQQRALDQRENQTRKALRQSLMETPSADQDRRVGDLHEQLMLLQRQRFDLITAEQKELAGFMTNVQRVRFQGFQENLRRQLQDSFGQRGGPPGLRRNPPPR